MEMLLAGRIPREAGNKGYICAFRWVDYQWKAKKS